jgi:Ca-activated chloride channel family protein
MHYQLPVENINHLEEFDVPYQFVPFADLPDYYRFSASVALFGGLLKKSSYTSKTGWDDLSLIAKASYDSADVSQVEYIQLIEKAKKIYHKDKKKKKKDVDEQ